MPALKNSHPELAVAWFAARILPRFHRLGGAAMPVAALLALLGVVLLTYTAAVYWTFRRRVEIGKHSY